MAMEVEFFSAAEAVSPHCLSHFTVNCLFKHIKRPEWKLEGEMKMSH
jgi:hypothetical protein